MVVAVIEAETRWPRFQQRGQGGNDRRACTYGMVGVRHKGSTSSQWHWSERWQGCRLMGDFCVFPVSNALLEKKSHLS